MKLRFRDQAVEDLHEIKDDPAKKSILKAVLKTLALMEHDLRHPSLNTHEFVSFKGPQGQKLFEAYAQQKTPGHTGYSGIMALKEIISPLHQYYLIPIKKSILTRMSCHS
jgi:hypothetical protein